ncbi:YbbC/YhhH family protein [bacterium]|nr:YbbC/YhhH family protein [bacterium]MBU4560891.1 YbbC/YhhH family protein [bacterium]MCG2676087.1 YbbC/YhhH family protein [bacterium]MCG2677036.1 YbbC/YhhH family protein [bacterium]
MNKRTALVLSLWSACTLSMIVGCAILRQVSHEERPVELGEAWAKEYLTEFEAGKLTEYMPPSGYVPDAETAISIALAVWKPIYGVKQIEREAPYFAYLVDGYWVATGSLPEGWLGGTAKAIIRRSTGEVVHVIHYK